MGHTKELEIKKTNIEGLLEIELPVFYDERGFFKENWQREKMVAIGLPDFNPVQHNVSFNAKRGVTRGMHAEPWDKLVSVGLGKVFACIVDLRAGGGYGQTYSLTLDESTALFIPAGCANSFQVLEDNTVYSYLVNQHWQKDLEYKQFSIHGAKVEWPIPLTESILSEKDLNAPRFESLEPYAPKKICVVGAGGQLGKAFQKILNNAQADFFDSNSVDITSSESLSKIIWHKYHTIINCAAYTKVDLAEVEQDQSYAVNVQGVKNLADVAKKYNLILVYVSTDYVFDGKKEGEYAEVDLPRPLSIYGLHKLLGEKAVESLNKYYIIRTSWVIGEGLNFVNKMIELGQKDINPSVVNDQLGRPTLALDLAKFIQHLLEHHSEYGTYHFSNSGDVVSFADVARFVFAEKHMSTIVTNTTTAEFFAGKENIAPRPLNSTFALSKTENTGFNIPDWQDSLRSFLKET